MPARIISSLSLWFMLVVGSIANIVAAGATHFSADTLYTNGVIWTGKKDTSDASVLAVKNGKIIYVGNERNVGFEAKKTIDLKGLFMMPGFIDNHVHFFEGGFGLASVDLRDAMTPSLFVQRITDYANTMSKGRWVLNGNWDHQLWGGELPHKKWIDSKTGNTPVFVIRIDGHMALANTAALKLAGITTHTNAPDGGEIILDDDGELTGIIKGNALNLVLNVIPKPSDEQTLQAFELAQGHALRLGVTQVHAMTANPTEKSMIEDFKLAFDSGKMKIRAYVYTPIEHRHATQKFIDDNGTGNEILRWGGKRLCRWIIGSCNRVVS